MVVSTSRYRNIPMTGCACNYEKFDGCLRRPIPNTSHLIMHGWSEIGILGESLESDDDNNKYDNYIING
jgi:hypothetical protein